MWNCAVAQMSSTPQINNFEPKNLKNNTKHKNQYSFDYWIKTEQNREQWSLMDGLVLEDLTIHLTNAQNNKVFIIINHIRLLNKYHNLINPPP